ncbi:hypothetical protein [Sphingomonas sp. DT-204]|uniref:hypothetical protein n=1 Tax=Sphingomonas sp. DT-204 TaxID=3396166 RepID=UPI003F1D8B20
MVPLRLLALAAFVSVPLIAQAQDPKPATEKKDDPDRKICRREPAPTGSIMGGKRVCHTRAEWNAIDTANRANIERMQDLRTMSR